MIRNFFKVAFRQLWRNRRFSAINIAGLSLGMACSLLTFLWVADEYSVDGFFKNEDHLYIVYNRYFTNGSASAGYSTTGLLAEELKRKIPEIESACSYAWTVPSTFSVGDKILEADANHASGDYFDMFSYPLLAGDAKSALASPVSMAISRKMAVAFFGSPEAAIGRTIRYENQKDFMVSAVFEDLPRNASERFDCLINYTSFLQENDWLRIWGNNGPFTYILLRPGANPAVVSKLITHFLDAYIPPTASFREELGLQRFGDRYLHSSFSGGYPDGGRIEYVRLFGAIALFILLIACINFMNLSTARSTKRAREIGVRKVIGAVRGLLISQFIGESILLAFFAVLLAIGLVMLALPSFNVLAGKTIRLPYDQWRFWSCALGLAVVTGAISGSYPALILSAFRPVMVLKSAFISGGGSLWFRRGLVIFQFMLSITLIIATLFIERQIRYIRTKNLGYDRENLLYIPLNGDLAAKFDLFKRAALQQPGVTAVSKMSESPTAIGGVSQDLDWEGKDPTLVPKITEAAVGYDFIPTMKLQIIKGRDFSTSFGADTNNYIINESAVAEIGYKDPIGRSLTFWRRKGTIIGVVKDFHFQSLHEAIGPLLLRMGPSDDYSNALVRIRPGQMHVAIEGLEKLVKSLNPKFLFSYRFADEEYAKLYKSDLVTGRLVVLFSVLAIFISCLGLFGLSLFSVELRTKEIGIRKVLGADTASLFALMTKEFLVLVAAAFILAAPFAWWAMNNWSAQFAYRVTVSWWLFVLSGGLALLIALATVAAQALRAANANPTRILRPE